MTSVTAAIKAISENTHATHTDRANVCSVDALSSLLACLFPPQQFRELGLAALSSMNVSDVIAVVRAGQLVYCMWLFACLN